jgi:hypothetical protein
MKVFHSGKWGTQRMSPNELPIAAALPLVPLPAPSADDSTLHPIFLTDDMGFFGAGRKAAR